MIKKSQELECQTTTIGRGQGLSTKSQEPPPQGVPPRLERLQDRTLRVRPRKGASLVSERDLRRDGANQLLKAEHSPLSVEPPLLPQFSWVASALGTRQILGEKGGKRMLTEHTCTTCPSPLMSPHRKLRPSPLL